MRLVVVGSADSWHVRDLQRAAAGKHEICCRRFEQLTGRVGVEEDSVRADVGASFRCDAILVRSMPPGSLEQVVFRMDVLGQLERAGRVVVNPPRALETAVDKYLALARLAECGLDVPPTLVCQSWRTAMTAFEQLGEDVVVKPLFGSEGRGIVRVSEPPLALRTFKTLDRLGAVLYVQSFIEHNGYDVRLLVVGNRVLGMRRRNAHDWRTNISQGAVAEPLVVDDRLAELARRSAAAVGAPLAGVDLLPARDGRLYVLEVNAVPGWKSLSKALKIDVARLVLDDLRARIDSARE